MRPRTVARNQQVNESVMREIDALRRTFGYPLERNVQLGTTALWQKRRRTAEVCMVIRRPSGKYLTFRKTFYPPGIFRLLTGGVEEGEEILAALWREAAEETGLNLEIERLLAFVWFYGTDDADGPHRFLSAAFLLREIGGRLAAIDAEERVDAFAEADVDGLREIARQLQALPDEFTRDFEETWQEWGAYRAAVHHAVIDALSA